MFALPTLLWRGKPLPEKPAGKADDDDTDYDDDDDGYVDYDVDNNYGTIFFPAKLNLK